MTLADNYDINLDKFLEKESELDIISNEIMLEYEFPEVFKIQSQNKLERKKIIKKYLSKVENGENVCKNAMRLELKKYPLSVDKIKENLGM